MAAIELQDIHKRFGSGARQAHILRGIDLVVADGEFVVFVGPSGCGKSTLLRLIAGLESTSSGRVLIGGRDLTHAAPSQRQVAMVFQSYALYPHMTVRENLGFGMRMRGVPAATVSGKLDRAVAMLQLQPYLDRKPAELSGGQCQRVAIGRAIVQEPGVFLFDEPLSNLDAELRLRMRLEIAALHRELGRTMVYVTHDQVEAMTLAQRIVVLRDGRVEQVGAPMDLYDAPANTFVAGFIGSPAMNLLPAVLRDGQVLLAGAEPLARADAADGACRIGIRPEHLEPAADGPLALRVQQTEQTGASTFVHGLLDSASGGGSSTTLCFESRGRVDTRPGDVLRLRPQPGRLHVFGANGQRLSSHTAA
jgi:ABC-type sugar transport system ATPase subunit